VAQELQI